LVSQFKGNHLMSQPEILQALLSDCARNNHAAFQRLYQMTAPKLFSLCLAMLRRQEVAEEVLQDAFVQIWRDAGTFDPSRAAPMTWMAVIVRHRALDRLRRRHPEISLEEHEEFAEQPDDNPGPMEIALNLSENHALRRCLERLSAQQRESISKAFLGGLTHQQLSAALEVPIGTVKSWIRRGLGQLKRCLQHGLS
jgi:RNA polymerase sigma-70 factor (ECF subfamily)